MTKRQSATLWVGIALFAVMTLFPPWKFTLYLRSTQRIEKPGPYGAIFSPPAVPITELKDGSFHGFDHDIWTPSIDVPRLLVTLFGVTIVCGGLFIALSDRRQ